MIIVHDFVIFLLTACKTEESFEHVGSILVNISKVDEGREILLDPKWSLLKHAILQFDSPSPLRKKGVRKLDTNETYLDLSKHVLLLLTCILTAFYFYYGPSSYPSLREALT